MPSFTEASSREERSSPLPWLVSLRDYPEGADLALRLGEVVLGLNWEEPSRLFFDSLHDAAWGFISRAHVFAS